MSHLTYYSYEGTGEYMTETFGYAQSVCINGVIEISGQGGWYRPSSLSRIPSFPVANSSLQMLTNRTKPHTYPKDLDEHIHQAFRNVEAALKDAGGKGWEEVYSVTTYHSPMSEDSIKICGKLFGEYMPNHLPLWTAIGVAALAEKEMQIEIVVKAKSHW